MEKGSEVPRGGGPGALNNSSFLAYSSLVNSPRYVVFFCYEFSFFRTRVTYVILWENFLVSLIGKVERLTEEIKAVNPHEKGATFV